MACCRFCMNIFLGWKFYLQSYIPPICYMRTLSLSLSRRPFFHLKQATSMPSLALPWIPRSAVYVRVCVLRAWECCTQAINCQNSPTCFISVDNHFPRKGVFLPQPLDDCTHTMCVCVCVCVLCSSAANVSNRLRAKKGQIYTDAYTMQTAILYSTDFTFVRENTHTHTRTQTGLPACVFVDSKQAVGYSWKCSWSVSIHLSAGPTEHAKTVCWFDELTFVNLAKYYKIIHNLK